LFFSVQLAQQVSEIPTWVFYYLHLNQPSSSSLLRGYCTNFNNLKTSLQQYTYGALVISNKNKLLRKLEGVGVG